MSSPTVPAAAIRPGVLDDLPALTEIYNHYVRTSNATFDVTPFTVAGPAGVVRPLRADRVRTACWSPSRDGEVLGYATSSPLRPKPAYDTSVETTIYCRPDAVGHGLGRRLYDALLAELAGEDLHRAYAGVAAAERRLGGAAPGGRVHAARHLPRGGSQVRPVLGRRSGSSSPCPTPRPAPNGSAQ